MSDDFRELMTLRALREIGALETLLERRHDPVSLAAETEMTERAAEITLSALADWGYLQLEQEGYVATDRLRGIGDVDEVTTIGSLPHRLDYVEAYIQLPETLTGERPPEPDAQWRRNLTGSMATASAETVRATVTAAEHAHPRPERVLDVGGGPGNFAREFARRGAQVTLVDHPDVIELVSGMSTDERLELVGGDVLVDLPGTFDLAFCSRVTHMFSPAENRRLFENVRDALREGGTLVCTDYVRGRSDGAPGFAVHMLAQTDGGNTYEADDYRQWLQETGFTAIDVRDIPGMEIQAIVARRPRLHAD